MRAELQSTHVSLTTRGGSRPAGGAGQRGNQNQLSPLNTTRVNGS